MTVIAELMVALPIVLAVYSYVAYPAVLWLLARGRANTLVTDETDYQPSISIVVPAYNEETQIGGAIEALLAQDYPHDKMQILILSDASTDATAEILRALAAADASVKVIINARNFGHVRSPYHALLQARGDAAIVMPRDLIPD